MKQLDEFIISLSGSKENISEYSFELKKDFFEHFDDAEILYSDLTVFLKGISH